VRLIDGMIGFLRAAVSLGLYSDNRTQGLGGTFKFISQDKGNTSKSRREGKKIRKRIEKSFCSFVYLF
jgi:hypothetical protein